MEHKIVDLLEYKARKSDPDLIGHSLLNELAREVAVIVFVGRWGLVLGVVN